MFGTKVSITGIVAAIVVWFVLFVIIGIPLWIAFVAGGGAAPPRSDRRRADRARLTREHGRRRPPPPRLDPDLPRRGAARAAPRRIPHGRLSEQLTGGRGPLEPRWGRRRVPAATSASRECSGAGPSPATR